jgi:hypothetical protein
MNWPAGGALPDQSGFALIGDADTGDIARGHARLRHDVAHGADDRVPNFLGVVFDFAGRRIDLAQLALTRGERDQRLVEQDRPSGGRALVDGDEKRRQARLQGSARAPKD